MSLKESLEQALDRYVEVKSFRVDKDADNHGRKGTRIEVQFDEQRLEMYFADNNKMTHETVTTLVKRAVESFINNKMEKRTV